MPRFRIARSWLVAVGVLLGAPAVAAPASAAAAPSASMLAKAGVSLSWTPTAGGIAITPGSPLTLRARPIAARSSAKVRVRIVRLAGLGQLRREVQDRAVRSGTVSLAVSGPVGTRYLVSIRAGEMVFRTTVRVSAPPEAFTPASLSAPEPAAPPTSQSEPFGDESPIDGALIRSDDGTHGIVEPPNEDVPLHIPDGCVFENASLTVQLSSTIGYHGGVIPFTVKNTGTTCATGHLGYTVQRQVGSAWEWALEAYSFPYHQYVLQPGESVTGKIGVWPTIAPGHYRFTVLPWTGLPDGAETGGGEYDILPAP